MKVIRSKYLTPLNRVAFRKSLIAFLLFGFLSGASAQVTVQFTSVAYNDSENSGGNPPVILVSGGSIGFFDDRLVQITDLLTGTATSGTDYSYPTNPTNWIIPFGDYTIPQTFDLDNITTFSITNENVVESDETINFGLSTSSPVISIGGNSSTTYTINNDDAASVTVNNQTEEEGSALIFTITLDNPVQGGFDVDINFTDGTATGGSAPLSPPSDYANDPQTESFDGTAGEIETFAVTTLDDNQVENTESFTVQLTASLALVDDSDTGTGSITDNDVPGVVVSPISGPTTEGGGTATFNVSLTSVPTDPVTIPLTSNDLGEGTVQASVTINPGQWNGGVDVTVTGVDDTIVDGDIGYTIVTGNVTSDDSDYNSINANNVDDVAVTNLDDEIAGVLINPVNGLITTEDGESDSFLVTLTAESTAPVTIALSSSDPTEGIISTTSVTLQVDEWDTGQSVVITGVDDDLDDGDIGYTIVTGNVTSANAGYNALGGDDVDDVSVTNIDDDTAGVIISPTSGLITTEGGGTDDFTVTLTAEPTAQVTIALSSDDTTEGTVPPSVQIDPGDWDKLTAVTVTGVDDAIVDGDIPYNIVTGDVSSADPAYDALTGGDVDDVAVINEDDDVASLSITNETELENVSGGTMTFTVTLDNGIDGGTQVSFSFIDGTATLGSDYNGTAGTLVFIGNAGETATIPVTLIDEALVEADETFTVQLGTPTNGVQLDNGGTGTGTILNDDVCAAGGTAPELNPDVPTVFCDAITVSLDNYVQNAPPPASELVWSINPDPLEQSGWLSDSQVNDPTAGTYYGFFYDSLNDCASPTLEITISVNTTPQITGTTSDTRCGEGIVNLEATGIIPGSNNAPNFAWYASQTSTEVLSNLATFSPSISATTTFWVEATSEGCTTEREGVTATVVPPVSAGTPMNGSACSVEANGPTTIDLDDQLTGADPGMWTITSDPSGNLTINPNNNVVNFEGRPDGTYVFTYSTTGAQDPCPNESVEVSILVNDCDVDTDGDGLFDGEEAALGTDPLEKDTDDDGINDFDEVGPDVNNPLDEDNDGIIDALDSNVIDSDMDGVNDQQDPGNLDPCIPNNTIDLCDSDGDGITDGEEIANGWDPFDPCDPNLTPDCNPDPIDLEVVKTADLEAAAIGQLLTFTIDLNNLSDSRVLEITVIDLIPNGFRYDSHAANLGDYDPITGEWFIGEMQEFETATLAILVEVQEGSEYTNTARLRSSFPADGNTANNESSVEISLDLPEGVDLLIEKTAVSSRPLVGEEVTFTITVTNQSLEDTVLDIKVEDVITPGSDDGFIYLSHFTAKGEYDPVEGEWTIPVLAKDEQAVLDILVQVPMAGTFTNTARILSSSPADSDPTNNEAVAEVRVNERTTEECGFFFNQFSPNGDGTNDRLRINCLEDYANNWIEIYNRYGKLVFEGRNMTNDTTWDGTWKNKQVPDGTYFYILDLGDGSEIRKGWIQVIR